MKLLDYEDHLRLLGRGEPGELLDLLLRVSQESPQSLQFFNYYKEVPISSPVEVLYLFDDILACRTNKIQSRAIRNKRYTVIRSPKLPHDIYANAQFDEETNEIVLSEFTNVEVLPDRRDTIRVTIDELFKMTVEAGPGKFEGTLKKLSLGGCAIDIPDKTLLAKFTYFYLNFSFDLKNRPQPQQLRIMARFLRCETSTAPFRCIFLFEHDKRSEDLVGMYIAQRQGEIINELKV